MVETSFNINAIHCSRRDVRKSPDPENSSSTWAIRRSPTPIYNSREWRLCIPLRMNKETGCPWMFPKKNKKRTKKGLIFLSIGIDSRRTMAQFYRDVLAGRSSAQPRWYLLFFCSTRAAARWSLGVPGCDPPGGVGACGRDRKENGVGVDRWDDYRPVAYLGRRKWDGNDSSVGSPNRYLHAGVVERDSFFFQRATRAKRLNNWITLQWGRIVPTLFVTVLTANDGMRRKKARVL